MSAKKVFISYSHDSDEHRDRVLEFSERLRADGIETILDQYLNGWPPQGWPRWMMDQVDAADSVLVVCTETYYRRFRGHEEPGKGRGGDWEGALITQEIYDSRSRTLKFVPVFLSAAVEDWIPEPLRSGNYYALTSEVAYQSLYDFLLEQGGVEPQPVGQLKTRPRRKGKALTFEEPPPTEVADEVISPDEFIDDRIRVAATRMNQARAEKSLTMKSLVSTLDRLFERDTFRWEPSIAVCVTKEWDYRLHSALQTLRFMEDYEPFVETEAPAFLPRYRELTAQISRYALRMAAYLFDPSVGVSELRRFIGTEEFTPRVRPNRKPFENGVDQETCSKIDPYLTGAIRLMKTLNDEVLGIAESAEANPDQRLRIGGSQTNQRTPASQPFRAQTTIPADISRIVRYAPEELIGREDELKLLNNAWAKVQSQEAKRPHVLTFVALGGEGKTSLVAKWAAELRIRVGQAATLSLLGRSTARVRAIKWLLPPTCSSKKRSSSSATTRTKNLPLAVPAHSRKASASPASWVSGAASSFSTALNHCNTQPPRQLSNQASSKIRASPSCLKIWPLLVKDCALSLLALRYPTCNCLEEAP
jgi:hypothetical protein